ncbi:MAG: MlaD family protein [bacterium]|nr:MlaD family protein [bacterium]
MKKNIGNTIKLGIFVSIGILLFMSAIYFVGKKQRLFSRTFNLSSVFKDVSGLQVGNNVRFSGINLGTIDAIEMLSDTSVRVDMILDESARKFIKKDARASVGSEGLMGNKIISITAGSPGETAVLDNGYLMSISPVNLEDIFIKLKVTADNASTITTDLAAIMSNIHQGHGTIGKLFMDTVFASNMDQTLINLKQGAGGFKQNMDAAKHSFILKRFLKDKKKD